MQDIVLTEQEKGELEKRGFLVKKIYFFSIFLKSLVSSFLLCTFFVGFFDGISILIDFFRIEGFFLQSTQIIGTSGLIITTLMLLFIESIYSFSSNIFLSEKGEKYLFGTKDINIQTLRLNNLSLFSNIFHNFWKFAVFLQGLTTRKKGRNLGQFLLILFFGACLVGIIHLYYTVSLLLGFQITFYSYLDILITIFSPILVLFFTGVTLKFLVNNFHPLYAFGNLGEKIQSFTPKIEEKSKAIQENFQKDMNFSVLSDSFDTLSSTFREIISLVIKLEQVEKKANKGNLFDSEKYINSLRSDIVEPLKQLKSFLEQQREELLDAQKELQRVRVGGALDSVTSTEGQSNVGREQMELSSKRSESLLSELTENMEKLDEMIGKMG